MDVNILRSPRIAVASVSPEKLKKISYPPNFLPGARDVNSPYGVIRVYEWGPEDGKKVLFIHGLSTPAPALGTVADTMAKQGYRVMLLDLWGRGYSDSPSDLKQDSRLYATQILLAISTSPVSWTGLASGGFSLVGYSMGGGVVVSFAGYFPQLVNSVVLMAPSGLYNSLPPEYNTWSLRYHWLFPHTYIRWIMKRMLNGPVNPVSQDRPSHVSPDLTPRFKASIKHASSVAAPQEPLLDVTGIIKWEIDHHQGFIHSAASSIRYAPIVKQYSAWQHLRSLIEGEGESDAISGLPNRLYHTKILLLLGEEDTFLPKDQLCENAERELGAENLQIVGFTGSHNFPIVQGVKVAETICKFWGL